MKNIKLQAQRELQDHYIGLLKLLERIGKIDYRLDLSTSKHQALRGLHNVLHISLLCHYWTNGLDYEVPPVEIDGEEQYKVKDVRKHRVVCGER